MPIASGDSPSQLRSVFHSATAEIISSARRSALPASSGPAFGSPNTANTASPIYFSTVPPQAKICAVIRWWNWRSIVTTASGAICSAIRVKPTMSTKRTATVWRRTSPSGWSCSARSSAMLGEKISREIGAGALGRGASPVELAHAADLIEGLADGDFQIGEIDGLGDEIEGAAVHRGADVGHVAIGGNDDRPHRRLPLAQDGEQREPVHDRHVDVEQQQVNVGLSRDRRQRFLAVVGKAEFEFAGADLTAEALSDQPFDVGFVVDGQNFGWAGHRHPAQAEGTDKCRSRAFRKSKLTGFVMKSAAPYSLARRRRSSSP